MKNPSPLLVATLLLPAAVAFSRAETTPSLDLASMSTFENGPTPTGPGNCTEPGTARQFIVFHGTVKMSDVATHKDSDFVSLDKADDPVVKGYRQCLNAQAPKAMFSAMGLHAAGTGAVDSGLSVNGGADTPAMLLGASGRQDGASGQDGPSGGRKFAAMGGSGASDVPAPLGGSGGSSGLSGTGAGGGDAGTPGAGDPEVLGNNVGRFMAQRQGGFGATGGNGGGFGGGAASASAQPGFADGGAVADPSSISLTYKGTVNADRRMHGAENQTLNSGILAPANGASQVPSPDAGNPQPLGFRATTNQ